MCFRFQFLYVDGMYEEAKEKVYIYGLVKISAGRFLAWSPHLTKIVELIIIFLLFMNGPTHNNNIIEYASQSKL